ncbi:MAG: creatininase family protein [Armatimonadota bacterium]|nr:creatininase family protein [Armatimonadota bacterium]MDR7486347.1 creatininase family protein [Armatimonadota bacterium]MDR7534224.1 creatininase family protein [Armatimonadota bacterium]MDR7536760.1 creatininase family protein [Armatimonadota bacterium]
MTSLPLRLPECTWTEARERLQSASVAILPVGAQEAHGPHLPTSTDVIIAEEMATRGAAELRRRGVEAVVLAALDYVVTYAGAPFPGTIGITPPTLQALVVDIGRSLERQGVRLLLMASAHLEQIHLDTLRHAALALARETALRAAVLDIREPQWAARLSEEFRRGARHAGSYETSLVWAVRPDLVRMDVARGLQPVWVDLPAALRAGARSFAEAGSPMAYFGDPARSSREEGEALYAALATIVADAVEALIGPDVA